MFQTLAQQTSSYLTTFTRILPICFPAGRSSQQAQLCPVRFWRSAACRLFSQRQPRSKAAAQIIRYHYGDDARWADPSFDDSAWPVAANGLVPSVAAFGFDRTLQLSQSGAGASAQAAIDFGQEDDITVVTLAFTPLELAHA